MANLEDHIKSHLFDLETQRSGKDALPVKNIMGISSHFLGSDEYILGLNKKAMCNKWLEICFSQTFQSVCIVQNLVEVPRNSEQFARKQCAKNAQCFKPKNRNFGISHPSVSRCKFCTH